MRKFSWAGEYALLGVESSRGSCREHRLISTEEESRLRNLLQQSDRAYSSGDAERALQLLFEAQKLEPHHPLVLNTAGLRALAMGKASEAADLLRRALAQDGKNPALWVNLAAA